MTYAASLAAEPSVAEVQQATTSAEGLRQYLTTALGGLPRLLPEALLRGFPEGVFLQLKEASKAKVSKMLVVLL